MSLWVWVAVGLAIFCVLSALVTLAVATILGRIGHEVSELLDSTAWSSAPLARDQPEDDRVPLGDVSSGHAGNARRKVSRRS